MSVKRIVYGCDRCAAEILVKTESVFDWRHFEENWYTSLSLELCPACRSSARGLAMIRVDKAHFKAFSTDLKENKGSGDAGGGSGAPASEEEQLNI